METISISTLQKTQKQLWKTYTQLLRMYDPQVKLQNFLESFVCTNPLLFARSVPLLQRHFLILRRSLSIHSVKLHHKRMFRKIFQRPALF